MSREQIGSTSSELVGESTSTTISPAATEQVPSTSQTNQTHHLSTRISGQLEESSTHHLTTTSGVSIDALHGKLPAASSSTTSNVSKRSELPTPIESHGSDEAWRKPRQVIAVSASKGPAAFFNLARKFLVTDEMCDLSALEGAIVSAVDAAHLLERSKLATVARIQTSYVTVEPKRRKPAPATPSSTEASAALSGATGSSTSAVVTPSSIDSSIQHQEFPDIHSLSTARRTSSGRELRRARIVITVKRTECYKTWLDQNPLQASVSSDVEDEAEAEAPDYA